MNNKTKLVAGAYLSGKKKEKKKNSELSRNNLKEISIRLLDAALVIFDKKVPFFPKIVLF